MSVRAAGLIIYRLMAHKVEYLLMQTSYGEHHWTPPKGHVDPGETDWIAAIRETKEEAGIEEKDIEIVKDFKVELKYDTKTTKRGVEKKIVTYWLAKLIRPEQEIKLSDEHQDYRWLSLKEACELAKFVDMISALKECEDNLKQ